MIRLSIALSFFFSLLIHASVFAQSTKVGQNLDLNDCNIMRIFARVWNKSPLMQRENATWIIKNSSEEYASIDWLHTPQRGKQEWAGPLPHHTVALAHTHPDHLDPRPSKEDAMVARKIGMSLYVLSRKGIWRISSDGVVTQETGPGWFQGTVTNCQSVAPTEASKR